MLAATSEYLLERGMDGGVEGKEGRRGGGREGGRRDGWMDGRKGKEQTEGRKGICQLR